MSLGRNLIASMASSVWTALVGLAVVPLYLKYLGVEAYGLIGFFATMQAIFSLLDLGLATTINREVARYSAAGNLREAGKLLHTLAIIYWGTAAVIALIIVLLAPFIAGHWLQSTHLPQENVAHAVMLMGLIAACRWPIGVYQGALMGMQKLAVSSAVSTIIVTFGSLGSVAILAFVSPTIEAFFTWQACVGLLYALSIRWLAWRIMRHGQAIPSRFNIGELKRIWRFSAGMSGIAFSGVVLMQLDKVLLSRILSLEDFGRYTLAGVIASGLYMLLTPLFNAIYPRMSALVAIGNTEDLLILYKTGTRVFSTILFPIVIFAAIGSEDLVHLWTGNPSLAVSIAPIVSLLLAGTALNGVMHFPFALQLAYGMTRLPLTITLVLIAIMVPMIIVLSMSYGALGGATAWFILNLLYLFFGTWITHRKLLKREALGWLIHDVGFPLGISLTVMSIGWKIYYVPGNVHANILWGCGLLTLALMINFILLPKAISMKLRQQILVIIKSPS